MERCGRYGHVPHTQASADGQPVTFETTIGSIRSYVAVAYAPAAPTRPQLRRCLRCSTVCASAVSQFQPQFKRSLGRSFSCGSSQVSVRARCPTQKAVALQSGSTLNKRSSRAWIIHVYEILVWLHMATVGTLCLGVFTLGVWALGVSAAIHRLVVAFQL